MQDQIEFEREEQARIAQERTMKERGALLGRKLQYQEVFDVTKPAGVAVLEDLAKFCRANASTFHPDPRVHALAEGRREVWLRIAEHLQLDFDTLYKLYNRG